MGAQHGTSPCLHDILNLQYIVHNIYRYAISNIQEVRLYVKQRILGFVNFMFKFCLLRSFLLFPTIDVGSLTINVRMF